MRHTLKTLLAICLLLGAFVSTSHAQQPPVLTVDTTKAAAPAAPTPAPVDSMAKAQPGDSSTAAPVAPVTPAVAAPAAAPAPTTVAPAAAAPVAAPPPTTAAPAQTTPAAAAPPPPAPTAQAAPAQKEKKIYYGATLGFTFFGDVTRFYIQPMLGYKLAPRLSVGAKVGYEHLKYDDFQGDASSDNWGASVFTRISILPMIYGHAEYAVWSYDTGDNRTSVPYLLLGGGYVKRLGGRAALVVEALVDVLQDEQSPYSDWEPWVTVGVQVGF